MSTAAVETYPADGTADRYEARKIAQGWYTNTPRLIPVGARVRIDGPFGKHHMDEGVVIFAIPRQVVVRLDSGDEIVTSTPAVDAI